VRDRAGANVSDDFHVAMGMRREAAPGRDPVVVPDSDRAPAHAGGIVIAGEGKVMAGIKPAVVGMAKAAERSNVDHASEMAHSARPSSITHVTGRQSDEAAGGQ